MWDQYFAPDSLGEVVRLMAEEGPEARVIAGGTDLLVELRRRTREVHSLIDITRANGLDRVHIDGEGMIHVGPCVTHNLALASRRLVDQAFPLAQACWQLGTPQLRNRGTIVGNLVTASPANDTITALWAMDARLTLRSVKCERTLSFPEFYRGVRKTALGPDEVVTDIAFPALQPGQRGIFVKLGLRRTHVTAIVNAAVILTFEGPMVRRARIALGSVAPTIIRAEAAEASLEGGPLTDEQISESALLAAAAALPIDDIRAGADYRREMVRVLVRRALVALKEGREREGFPAAPPMLWGDGTGRVEPLSGATRPACHRSDAADPIVCTVNSREVTVEGAGGKTLLAMLREDLGLTGTKEGCGEGECGACTVWMDGMAVTACLVPAPRAHGTRIVTVEGLADGEHLHPVQQAFIDEGAVQCGYCTPGFVMSGANLLTEIPNPTHDQIVAALQGNLCRCTGYYKIVRAVERAAELTGQA